MTMTKEAIEKLPAVCRTRLEVMANLILRYKELQLPTATEFDHKLRGYTQALVDVGIICEIEMRGLNIYYTNISKPFEGGIRK